MGSLHRVGHSGAGEAAQADARRHSCSALPSGPADLQILNVSIYKAIGADGVYYGVRLGKQVPWVTGFPFNMSLSHPQYVGSVLTVWGCFCLTLNLAGKQQQQTTGCSELAWYWSMLYITSLLTEEFS